MSDAQKQLATVQSQLRIVLKEAEKSGFMLKVLEEQRNNALNMAAHFQVEHQIATQAAKSATEKAIALTGKLADAEELANTANQTLALKGLELVEAATKLTQSEKERDDLAKQVADLQTALDKLTEKSQKAAPRKPTLKEQAAAKRPTAPPK